MLSRTTSSNTSLQFSKAQGSIDADTSEAPSETTLLHTPPSVVKLAATSIKETKDSSVKRALFQDPPLELVDREPPQAVAAEVDDAMLDDPVELPTVPATATADDPAEPTPSPTVAPADKKRRQTSAKSQAGVDSKKKKS